MALLREQTIIHVVPAAIHFWDKLGLSPLHGPKDISSSFAIFRPDDVQSASVDRWLHDVAECYAVCLALTTMVLSLAH